MSQNVAAKLSDLATRVGAIGKDGHNDFQNFDFRGIDQIMGRFSLPLQEVGLVMLPHFKHISSENVEINGKFTRFVTVEGGFTFHDTESDEFLSCETVGEAADSFDKACNKAMATSLKYALLQGNMVPVGDGDMDATSAPSVSNAGHEVDKSSQQQGGKTEYAKNSVPSEASLAKMKNANGWLFFHCKDMGIDSNVISKEMFNVDSKQLTIPQIHAVAEKLAAQTDDAAAIIQEGFGTTEKPF